MSTRSEPLAARLGSVVLIFESVVVFLGGLCVYGLAGTPSGVPAWWAIVGGVLLALLMILASGVTRFRWGIIVGWVLQVVVLACAFFNLAFIAVALVFGGMWVYAMTTAARLTRQRPDATASTESE